MVRIGSYWASDLMGRNDSYSHRGYAMGNPVLIWPVYNDDGYAGFRSNRVRMFHLGVDGGITKKIDYRFLATTTQHWGCYGAPLKEVERVTSLMLECSYRLGGAYDWKFSLSGAMDFDSGSGESYLLGNNKGVMLTISKKLESAMRKKVFSALSAIMLVALVMCIGSCERAFPDDRLDYYWRLDRIEYKDGVNFRGDSCSWEEVDNTMFGFARHIVLIEDLARGFSRHGVTIEFGDSIRLDYSMYDDGGLIGELRYCGLDSLVTTFKLSYPDRQRMVLENSRATLRFRKW